MRRVIYPGTFDPMTLGHVDLIERALNLFDEVIVGVAANPGKKPLFSLEERQDLATKAVARLAKPVKVMTFDGLLVEFAREQDASAILRGLRAVADFEFEFQMALMNRKLSDTLETIFVMPRDTYIYLSSSIIKEISRLGGDVSSFVPPEVAAALKAKSFR